MRFTVAIFSLLAAVAIAAPITTHERTDTAPAMTTTQGDVVPFNSADVNVAQN
ncbi:hypothetical protein C8Q69DRAFT_504258 [Paecilomyces variotii]|uniref:Uncharacterized protein n=1 Tax=Byssochlamys spectabilis TaxID=264951 RepID=A0A443I0L3_BYSSP|nr:hypothetical protein C8Q69DRAFT_504258 [Paecilomyces variotii]RWQ97598.1 hypothetical protein C8Q69DRAFT_504258 [Paecilomyces variotii]